ncbi:MAG TPA: VOC family protein [Mucilaginibacter sp.]|nr:VOC family protein [Mucilaginibacter sp.]
MAVQLNSYLNFDGKAEQAFNFYKSVFGGEFLTFQRFKDNPMGANLSAADGEKILHVALPIGNNGVVLMASDTLESMGQTWKPGNEFTLSLHLDSIEEGQKYFDALAAGGVVGAPFEKAFWGAHWGMLTDKFGMKWMVSYDPKPTT